MANTLIKEMDFFEALDACEFYNGNPEPFYRCRKLYRDQQATITKLEAVVEAATAVIKTTVDMAAGARTAIARDDGDWRDYDRVKSALVAYFVARTALEDTDGN